MVISRRHRYKFIHNVVEEAVSYCGGNISSTDVLLSDLGIIGDDGDLKTPDRMYKDPSGDVLIIEVATSRGRDKNVLESIYRKKVNKYWDVLRARAAKIKIYFCVIVVSDEQVLSSCPLSRELTNDLVVRMRLAIALTVLYLGTYNKVLDVHDHIHDKSRYGDMIKKEIEKLQYKLPNTPKNPLHIDEEFIKRCKKVPDANHIAKCYIKDYYPFCSKLINEKRPDPNLEHKKLIDRLKEGDRKFNIKPVVNLPLFSVQRSDEPSTDVKSYGFGECNEYLATNKVWRNAMMEVDNNLESFLEDPSGILVHALCEDNYMVKEFENATKTSRKKYHRVSAMSDLDSTERVLLASQGVDGKRYSKLDTIKERRSHQQKSFSWTTPTNDISKFLCMKTIYEGNHDPGVLMNLMRKADDLSGNPPESSDVAEKWMKTDLYNSFDIMSAIMIEVAVSCKQHCKRDEMILKKLREFDVYLLIKPTKSSEHCYVSIFVPHTKTFKNYGDSVFQHFTKVSMGWMTDFVSFKPGKIENKSSMSASVISLASFWSWFYELDSCDPVSVSKHDECSKMLLLSLLIRAEDKKYTEEAITLTRYMVMECFKSNLSIRAANPSRLFTKWSSIVRSRLQLWVIKEASSNFVSMEINPPSPIRVDKDCLPEGEDVAPQDSWIGLLNPFTGSEVKTGSKMINLVYLGYLKNKDDDAEGNTDYQIIEKTVEEEFNFDRNQSEKAMGFNENCERPGNKQYDMDFVVYGCSVLEQRLRVRYGDSWKSQITDLIIERMSGMLTEEIASLKASCTVNHEKVDDMSAKVGDSKAAKRVKVLEAIAENLAMFSLNPLTRVSKFIEYIEDSSKGLILDLFKKSQHGGIREIFVMTVQSRVVQLFAETTARVLCEQFEEETLTHPENKTLKLDEHKAASVRIALKRNCNYEDMCSSSDKTRWNQRQLANLLSITLFRLTEEAFHPSLQRILNMWTERRIKLPQNVINMLCTSAQLQSPVYKQLLNEFHDPGPDKIFKKKSDPFIHMTTGFMQGILHYTSSLLHLCLLNFIISLFLPRLRSRFPMLYFTISAVCSSDDSAIIITIFAEVNSLGTLPSDDYKRGVAEALVILEYANQLCEYFSMANSTKSVTGIPNIVEFNSEFKLDNTLAMPVIKFVAASLGISEAESFIQRFHTQYNLLSDLNRSSFPSFNVSLCQRSQLILHYKTLGSSTNPLFRIWADNIVRFPDPSFGFFMLDSNLLPGVMGYSFMYWMASMNSPILRIPLSAYASNSLEISEDGGVLRSLTIRMGDSERWLRMVTTVKGSLDLEYEVEKDPSILFRKADNLADLKLKLAIKSTLPSVSKSMRRGNSFVQALASSVWSISYHCFSKISVYQDANGKYNKCRDKTSLLLELKKAISIAGSSVSPQRDIMKMVFPSLERYEEAHEVISLLKTYSEIGCRAPRNRRVTLVIQPRTLDIPLSLKQVLDWKWNGTPLRTSGATIIRCWTSYNEMLPWLSTNFKETLENSPFGTFQELMGFIESYTSKTRYFVRVGPSTHGVKFTSRLSLMIRKSFKHGVVLMPPGERLPGKIIGNDIMSQVSLALMIPDEEVRKDKVRNCLINGEIIFKSLADLNGMSERDRNFAICQAIEKKQVKLSDLVAHMQTTGIGVFMTFNKSQEKVEDEKKRYKYVGSGKATLRIRKTLVELHLMNDRCVRIVVSRWEPLRNSYIELRSIMRSIRVKPDLIEKRSRANKKQRFICRMSESGFSERGEIGTPIYEDPDLVFTESIHNLLTLEIERHRMIVYSVNKFHKGKSEVLRWEHRSSDIKQADSSQVKDDLWEAWMNCCPLAWHVCFAFLELIVETKGEAGEIARSWVRNILSQRLSIKYSRSLMAGIGVFDRNEPQIIPQELAPEIPDDELLSLFETVSESFRDDILDELAGLLSPLKESEDTLDSMKLLWAPVDRDLEEEYKRTEPSSSRDYYSRTPLFDELIRVLENESPGFWINMLQGVVSRSHPEFSVPLMTLMQIQPKVKSTKMTDKVKIAKAKIKNSFRWARSGSIDDDDPLKALAEQRSQEKEEENNERIQNAIKRVQESPMSTSQSDEDDSDSFYDDEFDDDFDEELITGALKKAERISIRTSDSESDNVSVITTIENYQEKTLDKPVIAPFLVSQVRDQDVLLPDLEINYEGLSLPAVESNELLGSVIRSFYDGLVLLHRNIVIFSTYSLVERCVESNKLLNPGEAISDGRCFYDSIRQMIDYKESVESLKEIVWNHPLISLFNDPEKAKNFFSIRNEWSDDWAVKACSVILGIQLCIHTDGMFCYYSNKGKPILHLRLSGNHYVPLWKENWDGTREMITQDIIKQEMLDVDIKDFLSRDRLGRSGVNTDLIVYVNSKIKDSMEDLTKINHKLRDVFGKEKHAFIMIGMHDRIRRLRLTIMNISSCLEKFDPGPGELIPVHPLIIVLRKTLTDVSNIIYSIENSLDSIA
uniref:RNA-dependent RNA polymerase n=1 Tax=Hubei bunya-like virus 3 TaxID=1922848 RepID=A0A1L3KPF8_9VIRU|nr:RNA-dependent RNA polymerase [Hubei bunya-like virus 3]